MHHRLIACALASALLATAAAARTGSPPPSAAKVLPPTFLRGYDPITVFFPQPAGPAAPGPEDHPERFLKVEPAAAGEWRWLDRSTLIFKPAAAWPPLARYALELAGRTHTLATLMVAPESLAPADGATDLSPVDEVTLAFEQPIAPEHLARMVSFELRALPGVEKREPRRLGPDDFRIKPLERSARNAPAKYVFQLKRRIEDGQRVLVHVRLALGDASPDAMVTYTFATKQSFRLLSAGCTSLAMPDDPEPGPEAEPEQAEGEESGDESEDGEAQPAPKKKARRRDPVRGGDGMLPLTLAGTRYTREQAISGGNGIPRIALQFSADLAPLTLSDVKALIRFTPALADLTFSQSGRQLRISGKLDRDTIYQAAITPAPIKDRAGRTLRMDGPSEFWFHYEGAPSYLRWGQAQGIVERFGPQVFPMSARRDGRVDLRIQKVDPLDRSFWPFPAHPLVVDETTRPPGPGEEPPPASELDRALTAAELETRLLMLGSPPVSNLTELPVRREGGATDFGLPLKAHLAAISGAGEPGTYLVGVRRLNGDTTRSWARIQVTDLCLSTIEEPRAVQFLVTSLRTGKPVPGASVTLEGAVEGTTDTRGLFRFPHVAPLARPLRRIVVKKEKDTLVLSPADSPHTFANNHWHRARDGWLAWLAKEPEAPPEISTLLMAHLLTERPVYRPEEEVHIKGYLRVRDGGKLALAPADEYELAIDGPGDDKRWTVPVEITPEGSFHHAFREKDLPTGDYSAKLRNARTEDTYGAVSWKMEAYVIPRFEVEVHGPDRVPLDRPFTMTATAKYYAGGRVVGEATRWRVVQFPHVHVPPVLKGFYFSTDERFSKSGRFTAPGAITKNDETDESGASALTINPATELDARPRRYVFEVTVTGPDEQTVTSTRQVIALPAFVLGAKLERFRTQGDAIPLELVAIDPEGKPLAGQEVTVRLLQRQWHSTLTETDFSTPKPKYVTDVVDQEIHTAKVTTADRPLTVSLPAAEAGIYVVELSSRDKVGRLQTVSVDLYKGGAEALTWKKPEAGVFETVPDKTLYAAGDTARILLKSPYQSAHVLAVVEAPGGIAYRELTVEGGKALFELPIANEYHPRLPVHFLLMRGRVGEGQLGRADLGRPGTMAATAWLKVDPKENRLNVQLAHPERALPGQEIAVTIKLATAGGKPSPGEVTLWLVDQAVLSLGTERELDPLPSFIRDVKSRLAIRDTRNKTIGDVVLEENPGGGGAEEPGLLGRVTPRKNFKTVPYYNPRIMIGPSGEATVRFRLSDDLTNFKVRAVAAAEPERFGFAKSTIAVRLPVIVQPSLPRFARISDAFVAGGIGRIVEGEGGPGRFEVKSTGAEISGPTSGALVWKKNEPQQLRFPMKVLPGHRELALTLAVQRTADRAQDAFEVRLPVLPDREPVHAEVLARLEPGRSVSFPEFDRDVRPGSVRQEALITDQEAVLKMVAALDYLDEYRHECTEQRVSMAYPGVALGSLLDALQLKRDTGRATGIWEATIAYLARTLQPNGLYAFWPGTPGQVSLTAYVVRFLADAKKAGRAFPAALIDKPVAALKEALRSDYSNFVDGCATLERAEALRALGAAGVFDEAYGAELARKAAYMDAYGRSSVLLAYAAGQKGGEAARQGLRTSIWNDTVFQLRDGREAYGGLQESARARGELVLASEVKTLATIIRALYPEDRASPRMKLMVDELLRTGAREGWGDTSANAAALLALKDVVAAPRAYPAPPKFEVSQGAEKIALALDGKRPTARFETTSTAPAQLTWAGGADGASFFAKLDVTCMPAATGDTVPAQSAGFVVRHEVVRVPADDAPPKRTWIEKEGESLAFAQGDVVEEHVQVINPEARNFVAVVVPLAAGMEPLNPNLATSPPEARPEGRLTLAPSYAMYQDDEVRFYYTTLAAGTYDFYFRTRATVEGSFVHPGAHAQMMYRTAVRGRSAGVRYVVQRKGN